MKQSNCTSKLMLTRLPSPPPQPKRVCICKHAEPTTECSRYTRCSSAPPGDVPYDQDPCPSIDEWRLVHQTTSPYSAPETGTPVLTGKVRNHPHFEDGRDITTSRVEWIDVPIRRAKSGSRMYTLGSMSQAYKEFLLRNSENVLSRMCSDKYIPKRIYLS